MAKNWSREPPVATADHFVSLSDVMSEQMAQKLTREEQVDITAEDVVCAAKEEELPAWLAAQE